MRITLVTVGRMKAGPLSDICDTYKNRLTWKTTLKEVEVRQTLPAEQLKRREAELLKAAIPVGARIVALDERGKSLSSREFASLLGDWQNDGISDAAFLIGGADGLAEPLRAAAHKAIAFGKMTWPHMMARALLLEQLYRAQTILSGHPYHRE